MDNASCVAASELLHWKRWTVKHPCSESTAVLYPQDYTGEESSFQGVFSSKNCCLHARPAVLRAMIHHGVFVVCLCLNSQELCNAHFRLDFSWHKEIWQNWPAISAQASLKLPTRLRLSFQLITLTYPHPENRKKTTAATVAQAHGLESWEQSVTYKNTPHKWKMLNPRFNIYHWNYSVSFTAGVCTACQQTSLTGIRCHGHYTHPLLLGDQGLAVATNSMTPTFPNWLTEDMHFQKKNKHHPPQTNHT